MRLGSSRKKQPDLFEAGNYDLPGGATSNELSSRGAADIILSILGVGDLNQTSDYVTEVLLRWLSKSFHGGFCPGPWTQLRVRRTTNKNASMGVLERLQSLERPENSNLRTAECLRVRPWVGDKETTNI